MRSIDYLTLEHTFYYHGGVTSSLSISRPQILDSLRQLAPQAHAGAVYMLNGEAPALAAAMQELINRMALQGPVRVILGNNRLNLDLVPLTLGEQAGRAYEVLDNLRISRAETCYQMKDVLAHLEPDPSPVVVSGFLHPFDEKNLAPSEVHMLLEHCLESLHRANRSAPVILSAGPVKEHPELLPLLEQSIDVRLQLEPAQTLPAPLQRTLF